jgi:hypothetical protein
VQDPDKPGRWYAIYNGKIYMFKSNNNATAHFSGYFESDAKGPIKNMMNKIKKWKSME